MRFRPEQHLRRPGDFRVLREQGRRASLDIPERNHPATVQECRTCGLQHVHLPPYIRRVGALFDPRVIREEMR